MFSVFVCLLRYHSLTEENKIKMVMIGKSFPSNIELEIYRYRIVTCVYLLYDPYTLCCISYFTFQAYEIGI